MNFLWWLMLALYVPASIGLIVVVLLQKGKGTGFAGAFGMGGGGDAVFGPRSGRSLPQRLTTIMAGAFMTLALLMSIIGRNSGFAPERADASGYDDTETTGSALQALGLGSGHVGAAEGIVTDEELAAEAPAVTGEEPAEEAPTVTGEEPAAETLDVTAPTVPKDKTEEVATEATEVVPNVG